MRWKITVFGVDGDVQVFEVSFDKLRFLNMQTSSTSFCEPASLSTAK